MTGSGRRGGAGGTLTHRDQGVQNMARAKLFQLILLTGGATLALGGCAGGGWLPWVVGAGLVGWFTQQQV